MNLNYVCRFEKQDGVVLMATTRNLKQIDEALQRTGRMDRIFHLQRPTQREKERILHIAAKETMDEVLNDLVDWRKVSMVSCDFQFVLNMRFFVLVACSSNSSYVVYKVINAFVLGVCLLGNTC